jgi:hypothetical protein
MDSNSGVDIDFVVAQKPTTGTNGMSTEPSAGVGRAVGMGLETVVVAIGRAVTDAVGSVAATAGSVGCGVALGRLGLSSRNAVPATKTSATNARAIRRRSAASFGGLL